MKYAEKHYNLLKIDFLFGTFDTFYSITTQNFGETPSPSSG
jgi:hypothetical protein